MADKTSYLLEPNFVSLCVASLRTCTIGQCIELGDCIVRAYCAYRLQHYFCTMNICNVDDKLE